MNASGSRKQRGAPFFLVIIVLIIIGQMTRSRRNSRPDDAQPVTPDAQLTPDGRYRAETTEGLGLSIALLVDNSGSMRERARGDGRAKYLFAREALEATLVATDSFIAQHPDTPVNVGLFSFSGTVTQLVPVGPYDRARLQNAIRTMDSPDGATAIGDAMDRARIALYRAGTIRKHLLVVTDGENTDGRSPADVAREISRRSEGSVRMYFIAFDIEASKFGFVQAVKGELLEARNGTALRTTLDSLYRGRILAESMDAGETLADTLKPGTPPVSSDSTRPRKRTS